jgi:hypothetical protein
MLQQEKDNFSESEAGLIDMCLWKKYGDALAGSLVSQED